MCRCIINIIILNCYCYNFMISSLVRLKIFQREGLDSYISTVLWASGLNSYLIIFAKKFSFAPLTNQICLLFTDSVKYEDQLRDLENQFRHQVSYLHKYKITFLLSPHLFVHGFDGFFWFQGPEETLFVIH